MELRACVEGLKAVADLGCCDIIIETDAMKVVHALLGDDFRLSTMGGLVHKLKELLAENFVSPIEICTKRM
jgi:ribonuclease HI